MMHRGSQVSRKSIADIRRRADDVRRSFGLGDGYMDIVSFLEFELAGRGVVYHYQETWHLKGQQAYARPQEGLIVISEDIRVAACNGDPEARFTFAHEIGHLCLEHKHAFAKSVIAYWSVNEDSEWQADQFAMEILMPATGVRSKCSGSKDVQRIYKVTPEHATLRWTNLNQEGEK